MECCKLFQTFARQVRIEQGILIGITRELGRVFLSVKFKTKTILSEIMSKIKTTTFATFFHQ